MGKSSYRNRVIVARASSIRTDKWQWWIPVICMYIYPRQSYLARQPRFH